MRKLVYGLQRYLISALICMILLFVCSGVSFSKSDDAVKKRIRHEDLLSATLADEKNGWAGGRLGTIQHTSIDDLLNKTKVYQWGMSIPKEVVGGEAAEASSI
jgi:hypothetical protein